MNENLVHVYVKNGHVCPSGLLSWTVEFRSILGMLLMITFSGFTSTKNYSIWALSIASLVTDLDIHIYLVQCQIAPLCRFAILWPGKGKTYINQDNKDPGEVQPQHLITQSGVLLLMGRAKEGECEAIWDENWTLPKWLGSEVKSVPSIQYNIVSRQHNVNCTQHIMKWSVCYITIKYLNMSRTTCHVYHIIKQENDFL